MFCRGISSAFHADIVQAFKFHHCPTADRGSSTVCGDDGIDGIEHLGLQGEQGAFGVAEGDEQVCRYHSHLSFRLGTFLGQRIASLMSVKQPSDDLVQTIS